MTVPLELRNEEQAVRAASEAVADAGRAMSVAHRILAEEPSIEEMNRILERLSTAIAWRVAAQQLSNRELADRLLEDVWAFANGPEEALLSEAIDRLQRRWSKEQLIGART